MREFLQKKILSYSITQGGMLERVIERLAELGYVDDRKFVEWWARSRGSNKPKGKRMLILELSQKGVKKELAEEVFSSIEGPVDTEVELAKKALTHKLDRWRALPKFDQKKKLYDFLGRRGFAFDTIRVVVDDILGNTVQ